MSSSTPIAPRSRVFAADAHRSPSSSEKDDEGARRPPSRLAPTAFRFDDISDISGVAPASNGNRRAARDGPTVWTREASTTKLAVDDDDDDVIFDALVPVQPPESQLGSFLAAAADVTRTQESLLQAVNRLTTAAKRQHQDCGALSAQHQRLATRVDTVWQTAVEVREEATNLTNAMHRHLRYADETHRYFHSKVDSIERLLGSVVQRLNRTTVVAQRASTQLLATKTMTSLLRPYFSSWVRRAMLRRALHAVVRRTKRCGQRGVFERWLLFARLKSLQRTRRRCVDALLHDTVQGRRSRYFHNWLQYLQVRRTARKKLGMLRFFGDKGLLRIFYQKLQRHAQESRRNRVKSLFLLSQSKKYRMRHAYLQWLKLALERRRRVRNLRLVALLSHNVERLRMRRSYTKWRLVHETHNKVRRELVAMRRRSAVIILRSFYNKWHLIVLRRWMLSEVRREVHQLGLKLEIALRTASNTSETITRIMEHQHELEGKVLEIVRTKVSLHQLRPAAFKETLSHEMMSGGPQSLLGSGALIELEASAGERRGASAGVFDPSSDGAGVVTSKAFIPPHRSASVAAAGTSAHTAPASRQSSTSPAGTPSPLALYASGLPTAAHAPSTYTAPTAVAAPLPQQPTASQIASARTSMQAILEHYRQQQ